MIIGMRPPVRRAAIAATAALTVAAIGTSAAAAAPAGSDRPAASGAQRWVSSYPGPSDDLNAAESAEVVSGNTVFVTGTSYTGVSTVAYDATTGATLWTSTYNGLGLYGDHVAIAVSPDGETVYVTSGTGSDGSYDTAAFSAATGAELWEQTYTGPGTSSSWPYAIAVSPDGRTVVVTGYTDGTSRIQYATVAYNASSGAQQWAKLYQGPGHQAEATAVAWNPNGKSVYVTGWTVATTTGAATVAYNAGSGAQQWVKRSGKFVNYPVSLVVSPNGKSVYIGGSARTNYVVIGYRAAGGSQLWAKQYTPGDDELTAMAISPSGNAVFVTGLREGAVTHTYLTVAFKSRNGDRLWVQTYQAAGRNSFAEAMAVAASPTGKKVYVTGGIDDNAAPGDISTVTYNSATGRREWAKRYRFDATVLEAYSLAVGPDGRDVFVSGTASNDASLGSACQTHTCFVTVAYSG